jgi:hypothetical protein
MAHILMAVKGICIPIYKLFQLRIDSCDEPLERARRRLPQGPLLETVTPQCYQERRSRLAIGMPCRVATTATLGILPVF